MEALLRYSHIGFSEGGLHFPTARVICASGDGHALAARRGVGAGGPREVAGGEIDGLGDRVAKDIAALGLDGVVSFLEASSDFLPELDVLAVQGVGELAGDEGIVVELDVESHRARQVLPRARGGAGNLGLLIGAQVGVLVEGGNLIFAQRIGEDAGLANHGIGVELGGVIPARIRADHHGGGIGLGLGHLTVDLGVLGHLGPVDVKLALVSVIDTDRVVPLARLHLLLGLLVAIAAVDGEGELVTVDDHGPAAGFLVGTEALFIAVEVPVVAEDALDSEAVLDLVKLIPNIEADGIPPAVEVGHGALEHAVLLHCGLADLQRFGIGGGVADDAVLEGEIQDVRLGQVLGGGECRRDEAGSNEADRGNERGFMQLFLRHKNSLTVSTNEETSAAGRHHGAWRQADLPEVRWPVLRRVVSYVTPK